MTQWKVYAPASPWAVIEKCGTHAGIVFLAIVEHAQGTGRAWPSVARLAEMTGLSDSTVRRARKALESAGFISTEARFDEGRETTKLCAITGWQTITGGGVRETGVGVSERQGRGVRETGAGCQRDRDGGVRETGTGVSERQTELPKEELPKKELTGSAREAGEPPPHRLRDIKARNAKREASVATAMQSLRQHCDEVGCGRGGLDKVRRLLTDAAVAGLDAVAVANRLLEESGAWAECGHAGLYWSKPERLPAIIAEMQVAPVVSLTDRRSQQAERDAARIRNAAKFIPEGAPDDVAYRIVHAETREELARHDLTTWEQVSAWLKQQEASHAA